MSAFLPCLMQRWSAAPRTGRSAAAGWQEVRADVVRNLEWLLNTEAMNADDLPEAVRDSVLCFGVRAYSGAVLSTLDAGEIARHIRDRIARFEPRLEPHSLEVIVAADEGAAKGNRIRFRVRGYLRAEPLPLEFSVQTEIDPDDGRARVTD